MSVKCRVIEGGYCEITQNYKAGVHNGIDLVGPGYTLAYITAHSSGTVVGYRNNCNSFEKGSYGNYVKVKHDDGYYTLYAHMAYNTVRVKTGDRVIKGQILGYMGNTGESYGGHLHWEVRNQSDVRIDPTPYLDKDLPETSGDVNIYYQVETKEDGVLPMVKNLEDYAGWSDHPIRYLAMKADKGGLKYRVTTTSGLTLPWVTECDINNHNTGCAGNGEPIATVEAYYYTPKDIIKESGYKYIYYKVNDYPYQKDTIKGSGFDGYAGVPGVTATKFQAYIDN